MGIRVPPPTKTISSMSRGVNPASRKACLTGSRNRLTSSLHKASNCDRVRRVSMCFGPSSVAVMKGKLISVTFTPESSILAFSAASVRRWRDWRSRRRSMPSFSKNCSASQLTIVISKSPPPSWVSPLVDRTSKTPSPTSRMDTSNVPPPKSKTRTNSL